MTVSFYTQEQQVAFTMFAPSIIAGAGIEADQVYRGASRIQNYLFSPVDDTDGASQVCSLPPRSADKVYLVGAHPLDLSGSPDLRLCTTPKRCTPEGHHPRCDGLFARLAAEHRTDLHLLSCRVAVRPPRDERPAAPGTVVYTGVDRHRHGWQLPIVATGPTGRGRLAPTAPENLGEDVLAMERTLLNVAVNDPYATLARVRSMPAASVATLRGAHVLPVWMALTENPLTPSSPPDVIESARKMINEMKRDRVPDSATGRDLLRLFKRALPTQTRSVLFGTPPPLLALRPTLAEGWADPATRNDFQEWLAGRKRSTVTIGLGGLYNTVRLQRRELAGAKPVNALRQLVLRLRSADARAILRDGPQASDLPDFVTVAKQLLELYTRATRPGVEEGTQPSQIAVDAMFVGAVGDVLSAIEAHVAEQLKPHYEEYLLERYPDHRDQRYLDQLLAD